MYLYKSQNLDLANCRVEYSISDELLLTGLFADRVFWIKFDALDLKKIPEQVLNIPLILNAAPVIWASGQLVRVPTIDRSLSNALAVLKDAVAQMYPNTAWLGDIEADAIMDHSVASNSENQCALFSGGLDSIYTAFAHRKTLSTLITIRGSDISLNDEPGWKAVLDHASQFSQSLGLSNTWIESNFYSFLNHAKLDLLDKDMPSWWGGVQHGMGFAGLIGPIVYERNLKLCLIASSHSQSFQTPWGSDPRIDDKISFLSARFIHDGYHLTRHQKIRSLIEMLKKSNLPKPHLRVCYRNVTHAGENCCRCEKCIRTITSLIVENVDPIPFGFSAPIELALADFRKSIKNRNLVFADTTAYMWRDIQSHIGSLEEIRRADLANKYIEHISWVRSFNFDQYTSESKRRYKKLHKVIHFLRKYPKLFGLAKKIYTSLPAQKD